MSKDQIHQDPLIKTLLRWCEAIADFPDCISQRSGHDPRRRGKRVRVQLFGQQVASVRVQQRPYHRVDFVARVNYEAQNQVPNEFGSKLPFQNMQ